MSWLTVLSIWVGSPLDFLEKHCAFQREDRRATATQGEEVGALWRDDGGFGLWRMKGLNWTAIPILVLFPIARAELPKLWSMS